MMSMIRRATTERRSVRAESTLSPFPPPAMTAVPVSSEGPHRFETDSAAWRRVMTCPAGCGCRGTTQETTP